MKTKKMIALVCSLALMLSLNVSAFAAETESKTIDLGDGFYVVETITYGPMTRSGDIAGTKSATLYQGSIQVGRATLVATFDISGSTAKATDAEIDGTGYNGWYYSRGTARCTGNTAYGTAYFTPGNTEKRLDISLSCSPDGTLS